MFVWHLIYGFGKTDKGLSEITLSVFINFKQVKKMGKK